MNTENAAAQEKFVETDRVFSNYEWVEIGEKLENFHAIFQKFWSLGMPRFTKTLPTAAVEFDRLGDCIDFMINPDFWDSLNEEQRLFIICHEVTHVLFYHGLRINLLTKPEELQTANLALDIVVNHFLTDVLGFDRANVDPPVPPEDLTPEQRKQFPNGFPDGRLCWIESVFPDPKRRPSVGQSFEYYHTLVKKEIEQNPNGAAGQMSSIDDHSGLNSFNNATFEKKMKESLDRTDQDALDQTPQFKEMAKKELEDPKNKAVAKQAGIDAGNSWIIVKVKKVIPKRKWETVIKNWASKYLQEKVAEQWQKTHRRMVNMPKDFLIPSEHEIEEYEKNRIPVWFFQDTSGSCAHLAERFFNAAQTLPEDRFIVKMHCFDTKVYETDLKSKKLYGFGGTSFTCIEQYIQDQVRKTRCAYPDACFIITDGYGDRVSPEKPQRWFWFLSESYKDCIPKESKTFMLTDFE